MFKNIPVRRERLVIELTVNSAKNITKEYVSEFLVKMSHVLEMTIIFGPFCKEWAKEHNPQKYGGFEALLVWAESGTQLYWWEEEKFLTIDMYTCKTFSVEKAIALTEECFDIDSIAYRKIDHVLEANPNNNPKAEILRTSNGKGLVALDAIRKDEVVAVFDGEVYSAPTEMELPEIALNTAAPFHRFHYRDGKPTSFSRFVNHSCEPNCGIKNLFDIVAMRDIGPGEELTIDYGMLCNSNWHNPEGRCLCGSPSCRGKILPYRDLPQSAKDSYKGYISEWLL